MNNDKLYFYRYESPYKVVERISLSIKKDDVIEKLSDNIDFETFMKKVGFYQR